MMALPFMLLGWGLMAGVGQGLNALTVGEDTARTMGINLRALKLRIVVGTAISVGAAVSVCGSIGFVGLIVPHIVRMLTGPVRVAGAQSPNKAAPELGADTDDILRRMGRSAQAIAALRDKKVI